MVSHLKMPIPHIMPWDSFYTLLGLEHTCNCLCFSVCLCACMCVHIRYLRSEDHCWRFDPVGEEAVRCDDPHRFLPQCLCPHWSAALHGKSAAKVCHLAHQHNRNIPGQWHPCIQLGWVHHEWQWAWAFMQCPNTVVAFLNVNNWNIGCLSALSVLAINWIEKIV